MRRDHWIEKASLFAENYFGFLLRETEKNKQKIDKIFPKDFEQTLQFTGLKISTAQLLLLAYTSAFVCMLALLLLDVAIVAIHILAKTTPDVLLFILMATSFFIVPFLVMNLLINYPKNYAAQLKIHSLGDIPEIVSYLVMYLKISPNLEHSIEFTTSHSSSALAKNMRKMLWDMQIRVYHGIDDALIAFAKKWGRYSDHFKRSLHLIRSSVHIKNSADRTVTLDRSLDIALDGTRDLMNSFVKKLHQPAMIIYTIGVMMPLSLVAMLPAVTLIGVSISIFHIFIVYDIILPLLLYVYIVRILQNRAATFNPPAISKSHPLLKAQDKKKTASIALVVGFGICLPALLIYLFPAMSSSSALFSFFVNINTYLPTSLFFIWAFALAICYYCLSFYSPHKNIRDEIKQIESEFGDALYVLGKRIGESKSPEESFLYAAETMEGSTIASVFEKTSYNLTAMHTTLKEALFDKRFGSLNHVYSERIAAIMMLFVDGISKSQQAVSSSITRIADHLKDLQEVERRIIDTLYQLTSTLKSTIMIFAPLIAGVTLAINKLITTLLAELNTPSSQGSISGIPLSLSSENTFSINNISADAFVLVVGLYLLQLILIIARFTNGIEEGDDKASYMYNIGLITPISIGVFTLTIVLSTFLFSQLF